MFNTIKHNKDIIKITYIVHKVAHYIPVCTDIYRGTDIFHCFGMVDYILDVGIGNQRSQENMYIYQGLHTDLRYNNHVDTPLK